MAPSQSGVGSAGGGRFKPGLELPERLVELARAAEM